MSIKLLVTFGVISLLPLMVVGWFGYRTASKIVLRNQEQALTSHATEFASVLDLVLIERQRTVNQLVGDFEIRQFSATWPQTSAETEREALGELHNLIQLNPNFQAAYLMGLDGEVILSSTDNFGQNFGFRPYFQEALAGHEYISDLSISVDLGQAVFYFSAPVQDENGEVVAVGVLRVLAEEIWSLTEAERDHIGSGSVAILFDEYGIRMAHASDRGLIFKSVVPLDPEVEKLLLSEHRLGNMDAERIESTNFPELAEGIRQAETQPYFTHRLVISDELYHSGVARLNTKPWTVIQTVPESSFMNPIAEMVRTIGLSLGVVSVLVLLVTALATRGFATPIRALAEAARQLTIGQLDQPLDKKHIQRQDEFGLLMGTFESMRLNLFRSQIEQEALLRLSQTLLGSVEPETIARASFSVVSEIIKSDQISLMIVNPAGTHMDLVAGQGWTEEYVGQFQVPLSPPEASGEAWAVHIQKPVFDDLTRFDLPHEIPDLVRQSGIKTGLLIPMLIQDDHDQQARTCGVLIVDSLSHRTFDEGEVRFLSSVASQAAQALELARQYTHAQERLERIGTLHDIDVAIVSQLSLEETLNVLLEKVTERLDVDAAAIALVNPLTSALEYVARRGLDGEFFIDGLLKVAEGVAGQVVYSGQPAFISDVRADERFVRRSIARQLGIVSYMAVPLRARGEVIGALELAATQQHTFPPEEVEFFVTLAGQAAIVLDNARMYDQTNHRAAQARALAESAGGILATLDIDALWPEVTKAARRSLTVNRTAIYLYNPTTDQLTCPFADGLSAEYVAELNCRFREAPGGKLVSKPQTIIIADAQTDPATESIRDLVIREGFHSYAIFPLPAPELPLGAFVVYRDDISPFSSDDVATGQTLAHIVTVALQNSRLFESEHVARKRAETLREAAQALSATLNLQQVFELILIELQQVVSYDSASVQRLKEDRLEIIGGYGFPNLEELLGVSFDLKMHDNPNREVIQTRAPFILEDAPARYSRFRRGPHAQADIHSWLGVPLLFGDQLIGMIALDKQEPGFYTEEDARLVLAFAAQSAIAIENARLFEETQLHLSEISLLLNLSSSLRIHLRKDEMLSAILKNTQNGLNAEGVAILNYDPDSGEIKTQAAINKAERILGYTYLLDDMPADCAMHGNQICFGQEDCPFFPNRGQPLKVACVTFAVGGKILGGLHVLTHRKEGFSEGDIRLLRGIADIATNALRRADLFEEVLVYKDAFVSSVDAITITDLDTTILDINPAFERITGFSREEAIGKKPSLIKSEHTSTEFYRQLWDHLLNQGYWEGEIINTRKTGEIWDSHLTISTIKDDKGKPIAYLSINRDISKTKQRQREREAVINVSSALRIATKRSDMLPVILNQTKSLMSANAAALAMRDPETGGTLVELGIGAWGPTTGLQLDVGEGFFGSVIALGIPTVTDNLLEDPRVRPDLVAEQIAVAGLPLTAAGQTIGALFVGRPKPFAVEEVSILSAIGDMVANAIQRASLHEQTRDLAINLEQAYDATLEGWARALELRDQETEGHTRRVTEITLRLARAMGIQEEDLDHARRGALLHDIGKMGIPDSILLKPGKLTKKEWEIMRRHPVLAYEMLLPVDYLKPALEIPYCHHEKWDGTGYPQGLKGEAIPLAARIFAVIDVWDALCSDRPYRKGWDKEKVLEYIREQSGSHFDPQVVEMFLRLMAA
ncbi:MAG: GAF domain-containing protein [Anaerolineales bacterium]|nr:GAF domain-containing protein [Anaerolineales bacterium]